ncbi:MAG: flavodoxin family protein [Firmicutes bacterium]|nr:flavodoxin family protein [Bacillota bacterium]
MEKKPKVVLVNGSPNEKGCTYTGLCEVERALNKSGVETEIVHVGKTVTSCTGCMKCRQGLGKCVFDDIVNKTALKIKAASGVVFGSPVHYAAMSSGMKSFMDRLFIAHGKDFRGKPGAGISSARRSGGTGTFDQFNKYFSIVQMPIVTSQYWNLVHGSKPEDVLNDLEGLQTMRVLGNNMAWMIKCLSLAKQNGVEMPDVETQIRTNYIR